MTLTRDLGSSIAALDPLGADAVMRALPQAAAPVTASSARVQQAVAETADRIAAVLTAHHIPHTRNGQSKIEHFLAAGDADARH
ncbi:hypothetical protein ACIQC7_34470 [Kitasatospora sp. NPDC088556]|uniref:hypothetical protein n=1 Tax=Kitasatospora sp. NPDC088556 TaxID=3364076 RepID=UPI00381C43B3